MPVPTDPEQSSPSGRLDFYHSLRGKKGGRGDDNAVNPSEEILYVLHFRYVRDFVVSVGSAVFVTQFRSCRYYSTTAEVSRRVRHLINFIAIKTYTDRSYPPPLPPHNLSFVSCYSHVLTVNGERGELYLPLTLDTLHDVQRHDFCQCRNLGISKLENNRLWIDIETTILLSLRIHSHVNINITIQFDRFKKRFHHPNAGL